MSMLTDVVSIRLLLSKSVHRITQTCHTHFGRNPRSVEGPVHLLTHHHQLLNRSGHDCQKGIMAGVCKNRANLTVLHELGWDSKVMVWPHRRRLCGFGREGIHGHLSCVETCRQNLIYAAAP